MVTVRCKGSVCWFIVAMKAYGFRTVTICPPIFAMTKRWPDCEACVGLFLQRWKDRRSRYDLTMRCVLLYNALTYWWQSINFWQWRVCCLYLQWRNNDGAGTTWRCVCVPMTEYELLTVTCVLCIFAVTKQWRNRYDLTMRCVLAVYLQWRNDDGVWPDDDDVSPRATRAQGSSPRHPGRHMFVCVAWLGGWLVS